MRGFARRQFRPEFTPLQIGSWLLLGITLILLGLALEALLYRFLV